MMAGGALERFLAGNDVPCPRCGQNLRNVTSSACPECGLALALELRSHHRRASLPWYVLLIAVCFLAGDGIRRWLFAVALPEYVAWTRWGDAAWYWHVLNALVLISPLCLPAVFIFRRSLLRRSPMTQWLIAAAALLLLAAEYTTVLRFLF